MHRSLPGARISVHVQPRASRTEVAGMHGDSVKIRLAAAPVDNAANETLVEFVAEVLNLPKRQVRLVAGATSRRKQLEIQGISTDTALAMLLRRQ